MSIRTSALAGAWYPGSEKSCRTQIEAYVRDAAGQAEPDPANIGGIVPHAGWEFSGRTASFVYQALSGEPAPDVVVVFGGHLGPQDPNLCIAEDAWQTPLGDLRVHTELVSKLAEQFEFAEWPSRYTENTIEVQLPFIKYFFGESSILPLGMPARSEAIEVGRAIAELVLAGGEKALVIGSSDLTHYGPNYAFTPKGRGEAALKWVTEVNDRRAIDLMAQMDAAGVMDDAQANRNACCSGAAAAAISAAQGLGAEKGLLLNYATSCDVHRAESFVGYAGIVFKRAAEA